MANCSRLFVILLPLLFSLSNSAPAISFYISYTHCTFYYSRNSSNITFINCTTPQSYDTRWTQCYGLCCQTSDSREALEPSDQVFLSCDKKTAENNASLTVAGIVTSIFMGVCMCLFCCGKICRHLRSNRTKIQEEEKSISRVKWQNQTEINNDPGALLWSSKASSHNLLRDTQQPCSICLDHNTTAELFCGHQYHPQCIGEWLAKNCCCPNCRMPQVKRIKFYCKTCRWRYLVCSKMMICRHVSEIPAECSICSLHPPPQEPNTLTEILPAQTRQVMVGQQPLKMVNKGSSMEIQL